MPDDASTEAMTVPPGCPERKPNSGAGQSVAAEPTRYRSGAVARMLRMPVATLRIWERRYQVVSPVTTASGHRLYAAADVQRLALLRQLTGLGHAIGTLAGLDMAALHQVAATHASTVAGLSPRGAETAASLSPPTLSVLVVDQALALRLRRPALLRRWRGPLKVVGAYADLDQALADSAPPQAELLLLRLPSLRDAVLSPVQGLAAACGAQRIGVLYHYGAAQACQRLADAGMQLMREPADDSRLAGWLRQCAEGLIEASARPSDSPVDAAPLADVPALGAGAPGPVPPRRYDDATLTELAGLSTTIACECPRHVAELLMQLSHFEAYSAECASRSPDDAALHAYLQRVAGASRALFETALERVAVLEGLLLPPKFT